MTPSHRFVPIAVAILSALFWAGGCAGNRPAMPGAEVSDLRRLEMEAGLARTQIREHLSHSSDSDLKDSLQALDRILAYAAAAKSDPEKFDPEKIEAYNRQIRIIRANIERFEDPALRTTISFPEGGYRIGAMPASQRKKLDGLAATIVKTVKNLHEEYPGHSIRITLKSVGYTDETPIAAGSRLEALIRAEISDPAPAGPEGRRQYNQILSRLRATHANQFVLEQTRSGMPSIIDARFVQKITGMGERLPAPDPMPPYRDLDPRRRICIISSFIEIVL